MLNTMMTPALRRAAAVLSLFALSACDGGAGPIDPEPIVVARVEVTAPAATLTVGGTMQLSATPRTRTGEVVPGVTVAWESSDPAVAQVSAAGLVTAHAAGPVVIRATGAGRTGEASLIVAPEPVASLEIVPGGEIALEQNDSTRLRAVARGASGNVITGVAVAWSSSDATIARVTAGGTVHAGFGGTAVVTAVAGGATARVTVRVPTRITAVIVLPGGGTVPVGETVQMRARGVTAAGDTLDRPAVWSSDNEGVATVDALGRVTAHRAGSAVIRATMEGVGGRAIVFVPGETEHRLERAAGQAVPAWVFTRTVRDANGVAREQRVVATGGVLRFLASGYEQRIELEIQENGVKVGTETFLDRGEILYDMFNNQVVFESTLHEGRVTRGEWVMSDGLITGELTVSLALPGATAPAVFEFGRP